MDYLVIDNGQPFAPQDGKIEVAEVFGYTCGGCAQFEPVVSAWKRRLPADVRFVPVPAAFGGYWVPYARAYWAAETLGVVDKTHDAMFNAVHVQRSLPVQGVTAEQFAQFYAGHGVDPKTYAATFNSFGIEAKLNRSKQFAMRSRIESTPTMVVNGKYTVSVGDSYEKMLNTVEHLIAQERAAR
ncbi:thiol:disulfide interchange protein DsbA/DsbL [Pseudoxanthomonas mexicana]|uniref:thiol:disulfide interchange protein DsbA/DsbL n=1 Tax=Pseudoxanthomonas mexicana TaxID=128785 RepID=UPI00398B73C7